MQTFKQIPYQNYIQLKFSQRNIFQSQRQQSLLKYKSNAQLLSQIFSFKKPQKQKLSTQNNITQQQLLVYKHQLEDEKNKGEKSIQEIKKISEVYQNKLKTIKEINNVDQLKKIVYELKDVGLYDDKHPFFVEDSPFYLNTTEDEVLEVKVNRQMEVEEENDQDGLNMLQL